MRRSKRALLLVCSVATAGCAVDAPAAQGPGDPVVARAPDGAFAVAVPGLEGDPALAGGSVAFAVQDPAQERMFRVAAASATGWRSVHASPRRPRVSVGSIAASASRIVVLRHRPGRLQSCVVGGECTPSPDDVLAGPTQGPLRRSMGFTERLPARGSCLRRIAQLQGGVSLSGRRIAYARRVRCMSPRRPGRSQVVVRDLHTGAVRVVRRGMANRVELAGRYAAIEPRRGPVLVKDLRAGRVAYRAEVSYRDHFSLGADGTLARTIFPARCCSLVGRLGWHSPSSPRLHRSPNRVAVFSGSPLVNAAGRIAYVSRYDDGGATLSVIALRGRAREHASFAAPERLESFAFDGERLAFAHTRYRPYAGAADDGLRSICAGNDILVQASASTIEVHPVTAPGRLPALSLPIAAAYRSPAAERPQCPDGD